MHHRAVVSYTIVSQLEVFEENIKSEMNQFPSMKGFRTDWEHGVSADDYSGFIKKIKMEFENRFSRVQTS